jgi:hypothetical protein
MATRRIDLARRDSLAAVIGAGLSLAANAASENGGRKRDTLSDTVQVLDDYASLRAYEGDARSVFLRHAGTAGLFAANEQDRVSRDDGGTVIVAADHRRWERVFSGPIDVAWFGATGNPETSDHHAIQAAIDAACALSVGTVLLGRSHALSHPVVVRPGVSLVGRGPAYAGGEPYSDIPGTFISALPDFDGDALFRAAVAAPDNVLTAVQFEQFRIDLSHCRAHGFLLEDVYDGVIFRNIHVVGTHESRRACWLTTGHYGLGQTALFENCQFLGRKGSTGNLAPFRADTLNESTFVNCKFFGASGGTAASTGAAIELSGCSGVTLLNCSYAFAATGLSIEDSSRRKSFGIRIQGGTFESLTHCALRIRSAHGRRVDSVSLRDPRFYDSVLTFQFAIDVDDIQNGYFDTSFKKALVGKNSDQLTITSSRQALVSSAGTNVLVLGKPDRSGNFSGIGGNVRVNGAVEVDGVAMFAGGIRYRSRVLVDSSQRIDIADTVLLLKCDEPTRFALPPSRSQTVETGQVLFCRNIGRSEVTLTAVESDSIDDLRAAAIQPGAALILASDAAGGWWSVSR